MENGSTKWANPYKDNHRLSDGAQSFGGVFEETSPIVIYKQTVCSVYLPVHAACYRQTCSTPRSWLRYLQAAGTVGLRPWRYVVWIFNWDRLTGRDVNTEFSPSFWDWRQGEDGGGCAVTVSLSDIQNNTSLTALSQWWCSSFFNFISQQIWVWVHTSVELISFYRRENTFSQGHWWLVEPVWWRWGVLLFMCPNLLQSLTCLTRALRDDGEIVRWTRESEDAVTDTLSQTWRVWRDWKWYILHWNTSWWTVDWQQVLKMELESRTRWSRCWK